MTLNPCKVRVFFAIGQQHRGSKFGQCFKDKLQNMWNEMSRQWSLADQSTLVPEPVTTGSVTSGKLDSSQLITPNRTEIGIDSLQAI